MTNVDGIDEARLTLHLIRRIRHCSHSSFRPRVEHDKKRKLTRAPALMLISATGSSAGFNRSCRQTHGPEVLGKIGGFGGLFRANFPGMRDPVLVASIDGVGTKLKIAFALEQARHRRRRSGESLRQRHRGARRAAACSFSITSAAKNSSRACSINSCADFREPVARPVAR